MSTPSIILVRPQMGENIGAAARAMANFGLSDLRLVAPRDGWPNPKASDTAGKAINLIDDATVHVSVPDALKDCQFVVATTARDRAMSLPVMDVRVAMRELHARTGRGEKCAILYGPERTGLSNEDIALADAVVTIPVAPEYTSLNIGQAVVVCAYEWWMAGLVAMPSPNPLPEGEGFTVASREHLSGLLGQIEERLDEVNFWRVPEKKDVMWRNIRTTLVRAGMSEQEIATWRGMVKALATGMR
jgi:tRNA/rRNA methyltransferase